MNKEKKIIINIYEESLQKYKQIIIFGAVGENLLDVLQKNKIPIEAACGGCCACSTCHVILDAKNFDLLDAKKDDEEDMLDFAANLNKYSRLACQIIILQEMEDIEVIIPNYTKNL